jgi:hypothetical protein
MPLDFLARTDPPALAEHDQLGRILQPARIIGRTRRAGVDAGEVDAEETLNIVTLLGDALSATSQPGPPNLGSRQPLSPTGNTRKAPSAPPYHSYNLF